MQIIKELWGSCHDQNIYLYTLRNKSGSIVKLTNYGARIVAIEVPDKTGKLGDVVLGFDSLEPYLEDKNFIGATIGRFANRISNARFTLDDQTWQLEANEGQHCNHSGSVGFDHQVFQVLEVADTFEEEGLVTKVVFFLADQHNNGGFPGNLRLKISYCWTEMADSLNITYEAFSDRKGILNLTNHSYFNLSGIYDEHQSCLMHRLEIEADSELEVDSAYIPTGRRLSVAKDRVAGLIRNQCAAAKKYRNGVFEELKDLRLKKCYGGSIDSYDNSESLKGLNNCFELRKTSMPVACRLICDSSGRELEVRTSYPGLLVYTGDNLYSCAPGHGGRPYESFDGVALECQYYPDSPNHPDFPPVIIDNDNPYCEYITYTFSTVMQ